jgi:hypothetical protein
MSADPTQDTGGEDGADDEGGRTATTTGRQQIKPKRKRRM